MGRPERFAPTHAASGLYLAKPRTDRGREIRRLLVANRGEIACRIVSTARALGIVSIVIYTEEDRDSLHSTASPESVCLGHVAQEQGNPYQNIELLLQTARDVRADAVHPGYGYLSENADFAQAVVDAGLIFVGPSSASISALGDKRRAKQILTERAPEVPLIPGYNGGSQEVDTLRAEAEKIGYPILIKAAAGGGGRGMRIVHHHNDLEEELKRAQSEAQQSFGSADCLLEKFIQNGKHIEIQIVGDSRGDVLSLYDRECSIQRRHQKVIEEAPSPWLVDEIRIKMVETAKTIARLMQYENAGTVEFIVDIQTGAFYFLEVNTRIQVEHPITEMVTGVDIVALQLYVASGGLWKEDIALQDGVSSTYGHAIECRLCAEDPARGFLPDSGLILRWTPGTEFLDPRERELFRFETALQTGARISIFFDSMIAKVIVWAPTRPEAISKIISVLKHTVCLGIKTNQHFLQRCLQQPAFSNGDYSTDFISNHQETLLKLDPALASAEYKRTAGIVPALVSRSILPGKTYRPFSSVRSGFRNQVYDSRNRATDIVAIQNQLQDSQDGLESFFHVNWFIKGEREAFHRYVIQPLSPARSSQEQKTGQEDDESPSAPLIRHLNQTFSGVLHQDNASGPTHKVCVLQSSYQYEEERNPIVSNKLEWVTADITIEDDGRRFVYNIAMDPLQTSPSSGTPRYAFCHNATLGTNILCHHYSVLSFAESRRQFFVHEDAAAADPTRTYRAPMPCKVLKVLKENGETVKVGENLLIVESMKMEMKVSALADGVFQSSLADGDAVKEETIFCQVLEGAQEQEKPSQH